VTLGLVSRRPLSIALGLLVLTFLYGCQAGEQGESQSDETTTQDQASDDTGQTQGGDPNGAQGELGSGVAQIMNSSRYQYGEWGYLEVNPSDGTTVRALGPPDRLYIPGSSTKLFSVSATLDALGFDHRFETPVYAQGDVDDDTLSGDLVLVASGDLTMGGRTTNDGTVAFTDVDHTYANDVPGATLTSEDPLAGLDEIAEQVRKSGITRVDGDVIIDDRLFDPPPSGDPNPNLDPWPDPITINDNEIDVEIRPGEVGEAPESVTWRPQVAPYHIDVQANTVAAGEPNTVSVSPASDGRIVVSGNISSDAGTLLRVAPVEDPAAFARTALIEALERVGVSVSASPTGSNPASNLPEKGSYSADAEVASYESPPFSEYAKLILKVSHNYGANLNVCLMAVKAASTDCNDGFPVMKSFFDKAGVDTSQVALADGRGGNPSDRFTPQAATDLLGYWLKQPQAETFRTMLPELGVDGSLATSCEDCPAKSKVFAKPGTVALPDLVNGRLTQAESLGGYLESESGQHHLFYLVVNGATAQGIDDAVQILDDLNDIAADLQEEASQQGEES
jgi:D-alanyl-D-alanine carboxypeptidase/D-alanyl-D-alanine-endopeptidase (penicillin-binding protein 4)